MNRQWPDSFDFETDETCRTIFRPFIEDSLKKLEILDTRRPADADYIFNEHARRVATDIHAVCMHMGLGPRIAANMFWATLPHDAGKIKLPPHIWDTVDKPDDGLKNLRRSHTLLGVEMAHDQLGFNAHPFLNLMTDIMLNHHENMDGSGYLGKEASQLSTPVRLVSIVEAFDGYSIARPHFGDRDLSPAGVIERMRTQKTGQYDPELLEAFASSKLSCGQDYSPRHQP